MNQNDISKGKKNIKYKTRFFKRDRAIKIIKEFSEFLRILDIQESEILKTMILRFAIESVEASVGSLVVRDENNEELLRYAQTFVYEKGQLLLEDFSNQLSQVKFSIYNSPAGKAFLKGLPILIENVEHEEDRLKIIEGVLGKKINSVIEVPLVVREEVVGVIELGNYGRNRSFCIDDLEVILIMANIASATLENAQLFNEAIHDKLTGLYNIHYFKQLLTSEIEKMKRVRGTFSIALMDLDNFKQINDTFGHQVGDNALKHFAKIIRNTIRLTDIPARYGGDEFIIMFPETTAETTKSIAERIINNLKQNPLTINSDKQLILGTSIGISSFPLHGTDIKELIDKADAALYASKSAGKGIALVFQDGMKILGKEI